MPNRKKAEDVVLSLLKDLDPSGYNYNKTKDMLSQMSDKDFDEYMKLMSKGEAGICFFVPHDAGINPTTEFLIEVGKKWGVECTERLKFTNDPESLDHMTDIKYLIVRIPYKRQSQNLIKKISIPAHNKSIDQLTYQPTGESKGAKISFPELQLLLGLGLEKSADELIRFRGGDKNGWAAYNAMFMRYGSANLATLNNYSSGVESTKTLKAYLTAMHISNSI